MDARALICSADQEFSLRAVELPEPPPDISNPRVGDTLLGAFIHWSVAA